MAGIQADAQPAGFIIGVNVFNNRGQLFKTIAEIRALPGHHFQAHYGFPTGRFFQQAA